MGGLIDVVMVLVVQGSEWRDGEKIIGRKGKRKGKIFLDEGLKEEEEGKEKKKTASLCNNTWGSFIFIFFFLFSCLQIMTLDKMIWEW